MAATVMTFCHDCSLIQEWLELSWGSGGEDGVCDIDTSTHTKERGTHLVSRACPKSRQDETVLILTLFLVLSFLQDPYLLSCRLVK